MQNNTDQKVSSKIKILYILDILKETDEEHPVNSTEIVRLLAEKWNISSERKSISRDISLLMSYGYHIQLHSDQRKGWFMAENYFENWELKMMADCVNSIKFLDKKRRRTLLEKIKKLAPKYDRALFPFYGITPRKVVKKRNQSLKYYLDVILDAIKNNRKISFNIANLNKKFESAPRNNGKKYIVSPYGLYQDSNHYYFVGTYKDEPTLRAFRLDRIMSPSIIANTPRDLAGLHPECNIEQVVVEFISHSMNSFGGPEVYVKLKCKEIMADVVADKFEFNTECVKPNEDGFEIEIKVYESDALYRWLKANSANVVVLEPKELREHIIKDLKDSLVEYESHK